METRKNSSQILEKKNKIKKIKNEMKLMLGGELRNVLKDTYAPATGCSDRRRETRTDSR